MATNEFLIEVAKQGTTEALEQIWKNNLGMTIRICRQLSDEQTSAEDLQQESYFALLKAVHKYDVNKGYMFITYYTKALKRHLWRYKKLNKVDTDSLEEIVPGIEDVKLIDTIADDSLPPIDKHLELQDLRQQLERMLQTLPDNQEDVLREHYFHNRSLSDIAEAIGKTPQFISHMKQKGLRKLRNNMRPQLYRLWKEYSYYSIESQAYHGSLTSFKEHNSSVVEYLVIQMRSVKNK